MASSSSSSSGGETSGYRSHRNSEGWESYRTERERRKKAEAEVEKLKRELHMTNIKLAALKVKINSGGKSSYDSDASTDVECASSPHPCDDDSETATDSDFGEMELPVPALPRKRGRPPGSSNKAPSRKHRRSHHQGRPQPERTPVGKTKNPANPLVAMGVSPFTVTWLLENYELKETKSLPRALMYEQYLSHCTESNFQPVNAAGYGKLIRSVFGGLTTRRIGRRGDSKYHYCGIGIKNTSSIRMSEDLSNITIARKKRGPKVQNSSQE